MKKYFTFDTTNAMQSINNMAKFFDNMPLTLLADANLLGILIIACSYRNVKQADLITECLQLLGYSVIRSFDTDGIYITMVNNKCNMRIVNNHVEVW